MNKGTKNFLMLGTAALLAWFALKDCGGNCTGASKPKQQATQVSKHPKFYGHEIPMKGDSLIYILDVSGSMSGQPLVKSRQEIKKQLDRFDSKTSLNVYLTACENISWADEEMPMGKDNKKSLYKWLDNINEKVQEAGGGGVIANKVAEIIEDNKAQTYVLLTDGIFTPGCDPLSLFKALNRDREQDIETILESAGSQRMHVFGALPREFSGQIYGTLEENLKTLASETGGKYFRVSFAN